MSDSVTAATDATLDGEIQKSKLPILLDFWATWCGPCRTTKPAVEKFADETKGRVKVVTVNVDQNPQSAGKFNVMSVPTFLILQEGKVRAQFVGGQTEDSLKKQLEEALKGN